MDDSKVTMGDKEDEEMMFDSHSHMEGSIAELGDFGPLNLLEVANDINPRDMSNVSLKKAESQDPRSEKLQEPLEP